MRVLLLSFLLLFGGQCLHAASLDEAGRQVDESLFAGEPIRFKVELEGAKDNVKLVPLKDGSIAYIIKRHGAGRDRMLTPEEFGQVYYHQQVEDRGWFLNFLNFLFNTTSPIGIAWVSLGLGGQAIFMGRMLVQWFVSEKSKRSVIPVSFWWMSLIGSTMLLVYFIWRRDLVGILGNATGWVVYIRNLVLIYRSRS